jgi:hypothetical protein
MAARPPRETVDLAAYPDLVIIYLGMKVNTVRGLPTLVKAGGRIKRAVAQRPDGLLLHETIFYGFRLPHVGMRQYWENFDVLEKWARTDPHAGWWKAMLTNPRGVGFWHEAHFMDGGTEVLYVNMARPVGLQSFAKTQEAQQAMFSARRRLRLKTSDTKPAPVSEEQFYDG